jgi:hypothetical protein
VSYQVTIELDAPSATHDVLTVAADVALALKEEAGKDLIVRRIDVEEVER